MEQQVNVLALVKGEERFVFLYDDRNRVETLRTLGRFAADPELSFTWYDAAIMSKKIREIAMANGTVDGGLEQPASHPNRPQPNFLRDRFRFPHQEDII